jgi:dTDP-L-rhamnose 4-epimerase
MKNVLITGGAGFIGSNLALKLKKTGYYVTILDNLSPQIHGNRPELTSPDFKTILKEGIRFIKGSVTSRKDWLKSLEGQDAVIHLAAMTGTGQSMYKMKKYSDINIGGTALLLDTLANCCNTVKKILLASSRAIYGEGKYLCKNQGYVYPSERLDEHMQRGDFECKCPYCGKSLNLVPTDEESLIQPTSLYGITKYTQEQLVGTMGRAMGIPTVVFRYQNVYGPGQSLTNPYTGILSIFSNQIRNGHDINIFEDGRESRDFVYIDDVIEATASGLEKSEAENEVFNIGSGVSTDLITVSNALRAYFNSCINIRISGNYRLGDIRHNCADISKAVKLLGYIPKTSFSAGLQNFCNWVSRQQVEKDLYQKSMNECRRKKFLKQGIVNQFSSKFNKVIKYIKKDET